MNANLRIVIADDEFELLEDLREILQDMGHEVLATAHNGDELVAACLERRPDLVISDIRMPVLDGLGAAERIRQDFAVPFILLSAFKDEELLRRALHLDIFGYLIKPIDPDELETTIAIALTRFRESRGPNSDDPPSRWFG